MYLPSGLPCPLLCLLHVHTRRPCLASSPALPPLLPLPCSEQELRNVLWIAECVAQDQKNRVQDGIVFTF